MHLIQAFKAFFRVLSAGEQTPAPPPPPAEAFKPSSEPAIQLLALLQKEGRLLDFLSEDIQSYGDADVGAAVRSIHAGCRGLLDERVRLEQILEGSEGDSVEVPAGFDASSISIIGSTPSAFPARGRLVHRGWRVTELRLPTPPPGADARVAAPAEVEF